VVTITGVPGIGKTRLALEVTAGLASSYVNGACVVDLAPVRDEAVVVQSIATALGLPEVAGQPVVDSLVGYLRELDLLLVLDNCEHLLGACAAVTARIVEGTGDVSVLLTSREPLGTEAEGVYALDPLSLPSAGGDDDAGNLGGASEAAALFVARVGAARAWSGLSDDEISAIVELVERTDGIPLVIELLAAQAGSMSLSDMVSRFAERPALELLVGDPGSGDERHRSMQLALDWSHELLSEPERVLFRRVTVFAGGWTAEAAAGVCVDERVGPDDVKDLLRSLVGKSLVVKECAGATARFRLLETVRVYATERLGAAGEEEAVAAAHAVWYADLAERAEWGLFGRDQVEWLERLDVELDNLRAALSWALGNARGEVALRLCGGLVLFWRLRSYWSEGRRWLEAALDLGRGAPAALRAKAVWGVGFLSHMLTDRADTRQVLQHAGDLAGEAGDAVYEARALLLLGNELQASDPDGALLLFERAAASARDNGDAWCRGHALGLVGMLHADRYEVGPAREALLACVSESRRADELQGLRVGLLVLGSLCLAAGDYAEAKALLEEALSIGRRLGEPYAIASALSDLGDVAIRQGDLDRAGACLDEAMFFARRAGNLALVAAVVHSTGQLAYERGHLDAALVCFNEALVMAEQTGQSTVAVLIGLARVRGASGEAVAAARLFDKAAGLARREGHKPLLAVALSELSSLARLEGKARQASHLESQALEIGHDIGNWILVTHCLEALAALAVDAERFEHAARLFAAAAALRETAYVQLRHQYTTELETAKAALGADRFGEMWAEGSRLSAAEAVAFALRRHGARRGQAKGWDALTPVERDVVALVTERLSSPEIARRLLLSPRTVGNHLTRIYAKVGVRSRNELADLARHHEGSNEQSGAVEAEGRGSSGAEAVRPTGRARNASQEPEHWSDSLTPAERRVAALVAEGLSSPEIGERLLISPRTVTTHLTHIYSKLGLRSRNELMGIARHPSETPTH